VPKLELDKIEVWDERPGEARILRKKHPAYSLKANDGPQLFLQHGCVFGGDGQMLKPEHVPSWFEVEVGKMSPEALQACGFDLAKWKSPVKRRAKNEASSPDQVDDGGNLLADSTHDSPRGS
jgi:hypothetical protein